MAATRCRSGSARGLGDQAPARRGTGIGAACPSRLEPGPPPTGTAPSRPTLYDPDRTTCDVERIRRAFQQQLQPYADQSPAVLARLRELQLEMTRRSLKRCVERELLTAQQADQLARELAASPIRP
ncbi:hypothetical protein KBY57_01475 [Cyanobium sp. Aljojuca 7D2]|uniref:hypothetical protein n=1 Tax=Cyanobium sp. Aljojuca 7D2 TaxID=2823698 RepID=UPI0020CD3A0F|nr:hypothetical protein [Cyanobium sp. Aljojuca 7D2]MCP9889727.1 hypothetical protein [Cyanobium sp. Aljojuca 7D2]